MHACVCVCGRVRVRVCMCAWRGSWGSSSLHQMKGPFCHRQGLICQWRAVRSQGKAGTKVLKGCVTMRALRREPSRVGPRQHGTSCANHSAITFCAIQRPCVGIQHEAQGRKQPQKVHSSLCFASYTGLTLSLWHKFTENHGLIC